LNTIQKLLIPFVPTAEEIKEVLFGKKKVEEKNEPEKSSKTN
jgi:hypothetical protein